MFFSIFTALYSNFISILNIKNIKFLVNYIFNDLCQGVFEIFFQVVDTLYFIYQVIMGKFFSFINFSGFISDFQMLIVFNLYFIFNTIIIVLGTIVPLLLSVAVLTLIERKILGSIQRRLGPDQVGFVGLLQPIADAAKLIFKETVIPVKANFPLFFFAPILSFSLSFMLQSVIPFSSKGSIIDLDLGILYVFAISSLNVYSVILAGQSSYSRFAFLGALRSTAQMISYEVSFGIILIPIIIYSESMNLNNIVQFQKEFCQFAIPFFPLAVIFFISTLAETNRPPFDLPEAEAELVAGYNVEYSSIGFALFFIAEYFNIIFMSSFNAVLFQGGWDSMIQVPFSEPFIFQFKTFVFVFLFILIRAILPRYRYDQLMSLGQKVFLPISLSYLFLIMFNIIINLYTYILYIVIYMKYFFNNNSTTQLSYKYVLKHPYHLVDPSPQPFLLSFSIMNMAIHFVFFMHRYNGAQDNFQFCAYLVFLIFVEQLYDIMLEAEYQRMHTIPVQNNLKFGFALFILSEVMFFFGFFQAYFHSSLSPSIQIGCVQPPEGIKVIDPFGIPLMNTFILLISGLSLTIAHHAIIHDKQRMARDATNITLAWAVLFLFEQWYEYSNAAFNINDGIYGSTFYLLTGFHGFHVFIGFIFIYICLIRIISHHFTYNHHVGFESAAQYQHFVDVVQLALFISVYQQGYLLLISIMYNKQNLFFQEPATPVMEGIIDLHNYVFTYLIFIFGFVLYILLDIIIFSWWSKKKYMQFEYLTVDLMDEYRRLQISGIFQQIQNRLQIFSNTKKSSKKIFCVQKFKIIIGFIRNYYYFVFTIFGKYSFSIGFFNPFAKIFIWLNKVVNKKLFKYINALPSPALKNRLKVKQFVFRNNKKFRRSIQSYKVSCRKITHSTELELVWTLVPSLMIVFIAIPSLSLLYSIDELVYPQMTLKVTGWQQYWTYEISDSFVNDSFGEEALDFQCDFVESSRSTFFQAALNFVYEGLRLTRCTIGTEIMESPANKQFLVEQDFWFQLFGQPKLEQSEQAKNFINQQEFKACDIHNDLFLQKVLFNNGKGIMNKEDYIINNNLLNNVIKAYNSGGFSNYYIESFMINEQEIISMSMESNFQHRLLNVDNELYLPIKTHIRVLVTGADVLHSQAIPSLGIKIDAVPGRLNQVEIYLKREGVYYGQCSELCGANHAFMPIVIHGIGYGDAYEKYGQFQVEKQLS